MQGVWHLLVYSQRSRRGTDSSSFVWSSAQFFHRMGVLPPPGTSKFQNLNMPNVKPAAFPQWEATCNEFGGLLKEGIEHVALMAATGSFLPLPSFLVLSE